MTENVSLAIAFLAGLASFVSPCVLPLIPSYLSYITGISFEDLKEPGGRIRKITLIHSLLFILGFSLVFVLLGASASFLGRFLLSHLSIVRKVGGILIIFMGLFIAGVVKFPFLMRERRLLHLRERKIGYLGSLLVGVSFSAGWTACATPVLASILIYAGLGKTVGRGMLLLTGFSLGLGLPFLLSSLFLNSFLNVFSKFKRYLKGVEIVSGILLIVFGILIFTDYFSALSNYLVGWINK